MQERAALKNNPAGAPMKKIGYQSSPPPQQQLHPSAQPPHQAIYEEKSSSEPEYRHPSPASSYNQAPPAYGQQPPQSYSRTPSYNSAASSHGQQQPQSYSRTPSYNSTASYGQQQQQEQPQPYSRTPSYNNAAPAAGLVAPSRPAAPVPPPSRVHYVLALYDYDAQAEGDLSFRKDDKIELVNRTNDVNDWWTGRLRGAIGVFPGNIISA